MSSAVYEPAIDETTLVEQARAGDAAAYGELVRRHMEVAQRVAWVITSSSADAADAAQEGFVKAWVALPTFRTGAEFRPWLLKIVANTARNRVRATGRARRMAARVASIELTRSDVSAEDAALSAERQAALRRALAQLQETDRAVLTCRYLLERSEAETAAVLGWPRGTVKSRASRALRRLRPLVEDVSTTAEGAR